MNIWARWIRAPQTLWLRKAFFQLHLWTGVGVGLYVVMICLTGSVLVYRNELYIAFSPQPIIVDGTGVSLTVDEHPLILLPFALPLPSHCHPTAMAATPVTACRCPLTFPEMSGNENATAATPALLPGSARRPQRPQKKYVIGRSRPCAQGGGGHPRTMTACGRAATITPATRVCT